MRAGCQPLILLLGALLACGAQGQPRWREVVELQAEFQLEGMDRLQALEALLQGTGATAHSSRCQIQRSLDLNQAAHPEGLWWLGVSCPLPADGLEARRLRDELRALSGAGAPRVLKLELVRRRLPIPPPTGQLFLFKPVTKASAPD